MITPDRPLDDLTTDELTAHLDDLRATIAATRRERLDITGTTAHREPLIGAAAKARQDRDAQSNPALIAERDKLATLVEEMRDLWAGDDRKRWIIWRLDTTGMDKVFKLRAQARQSVDEFLDQDRQLRERARAQLAPLGIDVPGVPDHGRQDR
ncbi:hypothetical protein [Gordonia malaquae]|uniref:hypothetical protein n=1 Tax=Gordonia malaquae TaxID=410332 RepID=UPI003018E18D